MVDRPPVRGFRTVPDIVVACAAHRPDVPLIVEAGEPALTGAGLLDRARRGAQVLSRRGVRRGQFVAIDTASMGWIDVAAAYCAVTWLGAAAVMTTNDDTRRLATERMGATVTISNRDQAGMVLNSANLADSDALAGDSVAESTDRLDVVFTSGTTGEPKPVSSTHEPWAQAVRPEMLAAGRVRTVAHTGIPIAVSGGLHGVLLNHLARGVTSLCARTVGELIVEAGRRPPVELHLTPHGARAVLRQLSGAPPWAQRVRVIRIVGGPLPAGMADALTDHFPRGRVVSLYGLTEGGAALVVKLSDRSAADSIGRPAPGTEVCVLDADGREVARGQTGEVAVRSTTGEAMSYYREESLNQQWYTGGWTRTGDLGYVSADGDIRLVGRSKDLIVLRGGRVGPEAVERILARLVSPDIEIVAAGIPAASGWDQIAVFVCGDIGDPRLAAARQRLSDMSGPFRPAVVRVVEHIPRGPAGKPLRRVLLAGLTGEPAAGGSYRPGATVGDVVTAGPGSLDSAQR